MTNTSFREPEPEELIIACDRVLTGDTNVLPYPRECREKKKIEDFRKSLLERINHGKGRSEKKIG
jgi:hypothetical protein